LVSDIANWNQPSVEEQIIAHSVHKYNYAQMTQLTLSHPALALGGKGKIKVKETNRMQSVIDTAEAEKLL
jgi:hypothetical protein